MRRTWFLLPMVLLPAGSAAAQGVFRPPVVETAIDSPTADDYQPTLTTDQLTLYWTSNRAGGVGGQDIWKVTRPAISAPWSAPMNVTELNTTSSELYIHVAGDDLTMIISSTRPGGLGNDDLWVSTRPNAASPWGTPTNITELNSASYEDDPSLSSDQLEIFFTADGTVLGGISAVVATSTRASTAVPWNAPTVVTELDTLAFDHSPALSSDGLTIYWSSTGAVPGANPTLGSSDFYVATRSAVGGVWGGLQNVVEANTTNWDFNGDISNDNFSFFASHTAPAPGNASNIVRCDRIRPVLYATGTAMVGSTISIFERRDPGNIAVVLFAPAGAIPPTPLAGITGSIEINPAGAFPVAAGPCDANGRITTGPIVLPLAAMGGTFSLQGFVVELPSLNIYLSNLLTINVP